MDVDWNQTFAAIWRGRQGRLRPVRCLDPVQPEELLGIDRQKNALLDNTARFLGGSPANNALLWGARGTGKSSLVKAVLNRYAADGLRLVEVDRDDLVGLPEILDHVRELEHRFILYCDDLSFDAGEHTYRPLKSALEGSIEAPPANVLVYATSNRRHLLPEAMRDNLDTAIVEGELHYGDAVEEKLSLSERFGLRLAFHPFRRDAYLALVRRLLGDLDATAEQAALRFAREHASFSGRTARQFANAHA